ncbi:C4-dicarboxylate ABC transporter [Tropicimonas sp. TH_r6]|uniref:TRAP transporter substrate-binding protein n=1 Tax=Tropicimonas sp. TH_r6 TaxID=3082085 RepID=UPI002952E232|nr:C4-dicarboxylate ABC transporter [Tropicimonas sp. TH_r6]MDV7141163.1 C4-dicarboxylate ABC transporter [Tropicimonas sp. TH_r6]
MINSALAVSFSCLFVSCAAAETTHLDLVSSFQGDLPIVGEQSARFVEIFNAISDEVQFRFHPPGSLTPVSQSLESVSNGYVDAAYSISGYWQDRLPSAALFSAFPFGFGPLERIAWTYESNGLALYQEMYDRGGYEVKVVPCGMLSAETSGWFKKEINRPEDLDGLRMRTFGFAGEVFARLGVETELLFADGIAFALRNDALDAAEFSVIAADVYLGLQEHTDFAYFPGWHQPSTLMELLVNRHVWDGLEQPVQQSIETACFANILEALSHGALENQLAYRSVVDSKEARFRSWSPEMLDAFRTVWGEVVEENVNRDKFFRRVWADISKFQRERNEWLRVLHPGPDPARP